MSTPKTDQQTNNFQGFSPLNYTQTPDQFFDAIMTTLNLSETRVLLYIIRRTFGFKKESDNISISQMVNGIVTKEGKRLDFGTGLSKRSILPALRSLEKKGYIIAEQRTSNEHGNESTSYSLNIANRTPLGKKVHQGLGEESSPHKKQ